MGTLFNSVTPVQRMLLRSYTSKARRVTLNQDRSKIKVYEPNISKPNKLRLYAWGLQETGALGLQMDVKKSQARYTEMVHHPTRHRFSEHNAVIDVAAGYGFSAIAVDHCDGATLFGTGLNTDSQLGFQAKGSRNDPKNLDVIIYPTAIDLPRMANENDTDMRVKSMSAGRAHLVVATNNGMIFTMGNNSYGQCGRCIIDDENYHGSALIHRIPQYKFCEPGDEVINVVCGQDHTLFLTRKGHVYSCGWGADGQTGQGHFESTGDIDRVTGEIEHEHIVKISCASDCVLALNDKGEVFGWGNSEYGQLDNSDDPMVQINLPRQLTLTNGFGKVIDIAAGGAFCMMLTDEGLVYTWGFGILGFGPFVQQSSKPQHILPPLFGRNDFSDQTTVTSIGCGVFHMGAVNSDGDLFMWGRNRFGHLGLGHKKDQFFPFKTAVNGKVVKVAYGVDHTMALCKPFM